MVVDDDKDICFTVETIGIYAGWSVYSCLDGQSALAALEVFDPDLIILDYHMPFMNGLTVLTEFKTRKPSVIIIMLTVEDDGELAEKCREAGANDFALKPVKALDLIHRVSLNLEVAKLRQDTPVIPVESLDKQWISYLITARTRPSSLPLMKWLMPSKLATQPPTATSLIWRKKSI